MSKRLKSDKPLPDALVVALLAKTASGVLGCFGLQAVAGQNWLVKSPSFPFVGIP